MTIMMILILTISLAIIVFVIAMMFDPKLKGKMLAKQIKAAKYMMDESKGDIKSISDDMADATKDSITVTTRAIRNGLIDDQIFCKHCGKSIAKDSKFCKYCGKEQ